MALEFVGIDPETEDDHCPTVWVETDDGSIVIQGWRVRDETTMAQVRATGSIPEYETVVKLPARMREILLKACSATEGKAINDLGGSGIQ